MSASYKPYLMLVILLLNQWFAASAMACHMAPMAQSTVFTSANTESHSMPMHSMDMQDMMAMLTELENHNMDCCEQDCSCPPSACSSAILLNLDDTTLNVSNSFLLINYEFSSLTVSLSKFQKPPQAV
jgi:hypothetical protein